MPHSFEGTTLALQHYYDIVGTSRKLPFLTVYRANEQPFGRRMAVWMASYNDDYKLPPETLHRLDDALLQNRAIANPHALRVLDYGTSEGNSFVVTDALESISLRAWLRSHGPLEPWQALRLLDQLTGIITSAHQANFYDLCLTTDNIFVQDEERFEIITGPLGIGLHRSELLKLRDVTISADMMRHLPPWEFAKSSESKPTAPSAESSDSKPADTDPKTDSDNRDSAEKTDTPSEARESESAEINHLLSDANDPRDDSIQQIDVLTDCALEVPPPPDNACPDIYALAVVIYEALSGQHPFFNEDRDLCDAALSIVQAMPPELAKHFEISESLSDIVMEWLQHPKKDSAPEFLNQFASCCTESDRQKAQQAEKTWIAPAPIQTSGKRRKKTAVKIEHPFWMMGIAAAILILASVAITWRIAQYADPVDLFALPELLPTASDGIDVVISSHVNPPDTYIYLVSMEDGQPIRLGTLPYIYRQQSPGAKLNFLIADESGHSLQVPVVVKGENGLMLIPVDLNW